MYDAYGSVVSWMIAGNARIDTPDARYLEHLAAVRAARRSARRPLAPFAWVAERLGNRFQAAPACDPMTCSAAA